MAETAFEQLCRETEQNLAPGYQTGILVVNQQALKNILDTQEMTVELADELITWLAAFPEQWVFTVENEDREVGSTTTFSKEGRALVADMEADRFSDVRKNLYTTLADNILLSLEHYEGENWTVTTTIVTNEFLALPTRDKFRNIPAEYCPDRIMGMMIASISDLVSGMQNVKRHLLNSIAQEAQAGRDESIIDADEETYPDHNNKSTLSGNDGGDTGMASSDSSDLSDVPEENSGDTASVHEEGNTDIGDLNGDENTNTGMRTLATGPEPANPTNLSSDPDTMATRSRLQQSPQTDQKTDPSPDRSSNADGSDSERKPKRKPKSKKRTRADRDSSDADESGSERKPEPKKPKRDPKGTKGGNSSASGHGTARWTIGESHKVLLMMKDPRYANTLRPEREAEHHANTGVKRSWESVRQHGAKLKAAGYTAAKIQHCINDGVSLNYR